MHKRWFLLTLAVSAVLSMVAPLTASETTTYSYDALGRLVTVSVSGGPVGGTQTSTAFDPAGNRTSYAVTGVPPSATFSVNSVSATEGSALVFTVTKTGTPSGTLTVNYATSNGTATSASDYTAASGTLIFLAGEASKTVSVPTTNDTLVEGNETLTLTLSGVSPGAAISTATGTGTIVDNDISFAIGNATAVTEGGAMTFTVTKTGALAASVNYASASGTATSGSDFTPASGTLSFLAGDTTKTITVSTIDDVLAEGAETVLMNLSSPTGGATITTSQGTGTINDNDVPSFAIGNATAVNEGTAMTFTVTKTAGGSGGTYSVNYSSASGTATSGTDFIATSGTLTFLTTDTTKTITVATASDALYEPAETILMNISAPTGGSTITTSQGTGTLNNTNPAPSFSIGNASAVTEGGGMTFTVTKTGGTALSHAVNYLSASGTAISGSDFVLTSGTLTFLPTETTKTIVVATIDDSIAESAETVLMNISAATGGATIAVGQGTGTGTINDNEPVNQPPVAVADSRTVGCGSTTYSFNPIANDTDPENNTPLVLMSVSKLSGGADIIVTPTGIGSAVAVELQGGSQAGTSNFSYVVADSLGATSTGSIAITSTRPLCGF